MIVTLLAASAFGQVLAIVLGALVGLAWATESRRGR